jgi:hypothetical protein
VAAAGALFCGQNVFFFPETDSVGSEAFFDFRAAETPDATVGVNVAEFSLSRVEAAKHETEVSHKKFL